LWLSRLSKYTLVDVFAVIGVLVGVQLQLNVGGTDAVIRAEPRFGIIVSRYYVHRYRYKHVEDGCNCDLSSLTCVHAHLFFTTS